MFPLSEEQFMVHKARGFFAQIWDKLKVQTPGAHGDQVEPDLAWYGALCFTLLCLPL